MAASKKPIKLPRTPGECADLLWQLREVKRRMEAEAAAVSKTIHELEAHTLEVLHGAHLEGARGRTGQVSRKVSLVPSVKDWDAVYAWVTKKKALDLFERRLSVTAWRERLEARVVVPGVEAFQRITLHVTKVGAKEGA